MSKLSTARLKGMISEWLSKPEIRKDLEHHSDDYGCRNEQEIREKLDNTAELFGFRRGCTRAELDEHIWKMWCDGSQWKREEKRKLKDEAEDIFTQTEYIGEWKPGFPGNQQEQRIVASFPEDMLGECNQVLVDKYFNDLKLAEKCVYRMFVPSNQLANNYRLEVITTHNDDEVVGWWVTVD